MALIHTLTNVIFHRILFLFNDLNGVFYCTIMNFFFFLISRSIMNREELLELMKQKDDIEKELIDLAAELKSQNNVGMTEELVDKEGYPR